MQGDGYALVTGASRGLGMAFAREFAQRRHNLVLVALHPEPLQAFAEELRRSTPISVTAMDADLSVPGAGQALAARLAQQGLSIDILVNNAGFGLRGEFRQIPLQRQLEMLRLNNEVVVELTYALLPAMLNRPQKAVVNISSTAGFQPIPYASGYAATKAFLTTFSLALEQELRSSGVTVVTVCPGRLSKRDPAASPQPAQKKWGGIIQDPEDVVRHTFRVLANGGGLVVPGALNKFSVFAQRLIPRKLVPRLVAKMSRA